MSSDYNSTIIEHRAWRWACLPAWVCVCKSIRSNKMKEIKDLSFSFSGSLWFQLWMPSLSFDWYIHPLFYTIRGKRKILVDNVHARKCVEIYAALFMLMGNMCSAYDFLSIWFFQSLYLAPPFFFYHYFMLASTFRSFCIRFQLEGEKKRKNKNKYVKAFHWNILRCLPILW